MKKNKNVKNKPKINVYFLDDNEEIKVVTKTIPHNQIFIINKNGKLIVENYFKHKERIINTK